MEYKNDNIFINTLISYLLNKTSLEEFKPMDLLSDAVKLISPDNVSDIQFLDDGLCCSLKGKSSGFHHDVKKSICFAFIDDHSCKIEKLKETNFLAVREKYNLPADYFEERNDCFNFLSKPMFSSKSLTSTKYPILKEVSLLTNDELDKFIQYLFDMPEDFIPSQKLCLSAKFISPDYVSNLFFDEFYGKWYCSVKLNRSQTRSIYDENLSLAILKCVLLKFLNSYERSVDLNILTLQGE